MSHRALIGLVVVSIALNLLLAGLIGGHMLREGQHSPPPLAWAGRLKRCLRAYGKKRDRYCESTHAR